MHVLYSCAWTMFGLLNAPALGAGVPQHPADFNQDEKVDLHDWAIFSDVFGAGIDDPFASEIPYRPADLDADGDIDVQDLEMFLAGLLGPVHPLSRPCVDHVDCFDGNPCTTDFCDFSSCVYFPVAECCYNDFACEDFDRCTNTCRNDPPTCDIPVRFCCWDDSQCDDGNVCTDDSCDLKQRDCVYDSNQSLCDDGNACTLGDQCNEGTCTPTEVVTCFGGDQCNTKSCDPATGECITTTQPDGTPCSDGSLCTSGESCLNGICTPSQTVFCLGGTQCVPQICNPATGACAASPKPDGSPCNDGSVCTLTDSCQQGVCQGSAPVTCLQCETYSTCDPINGCGGLLPTGTPCDDGNACTTGDTCFYGICSSGSSCAGAQICCPDVGCIDLTTSNIHCGACGNACVNSICFQGTCFAGCVIDGVAYTHGTKNPANGCQICDTSFSRSLWKNLGSAQNPFEQACNWDCFTGWCFQGACSSLGGPGGCESQSTTCAEVSCHPISQQCVSAPRNEGAACTPSLSPTICRSTTAGTCQQGRCVGEPINIGTSCIPDATGVDPYDCYSDWHGVCNGQGGCIASALALRTSCGQNLQTEPCKRRICEREEITGRILCDVGDLNCSTSCGIGTCDQQLDECVYPGAPESDTIGCVDPKGLPDSQLCCPGMVCVCSPGGEYNCLGYRCWWPHDLPDLTPD